MNIIPINSKTYNFLKDRFQYVQFLENRFKCVISLSFEQLTVNHATIEKMNAMREFISNPNIENDLITIRNNKIAVIIDADNLVISAQCITGQYRSEIRLNIPRMISLVANL